MWMLLGGSDQILEDRCVEPIVAAGVEFDGGAGDVQEGRLYFTITDGVAQPVQRLAKGVERLILWLIGPQQARQERSLELGAGVHHQIDQQRPS